ncbi:ArsR/SmtB family transcription factor [Desulfurispira natronophila]|uniref:ArsR family transcriptional regulator n=1 Tax=Desulfurispira natronophila TaxID=682562 RepID=A0A7W7Y5V9_9BACT|nr:metalloregulator ArsR/SmtB family transcription factor [Desulfurispira natronophila]MBB5022656.1 ArsR family transcriptional regulator [Desulfurispira natronophila]
MQISEVLTAVKSLSDLGRLRTVFALLDHKELCACQITELLRLTPATVSRHMSILQAANLVLSRKEGRWVYYCLSPDFPKELLAWLSQARANCPTATSDADSLQDILVCDPSELCRKQSVRQ